VEEPGAPDAELISTPATFLKGIQDAAVAAAGNFFIIDAVALYPMALLSRLMPRAVTTISFTS